MESLQPELQELLSQHQRNFKVADNGKIECTLNGHTLPPRLDAVASFIGGAKYQKLLKRQTADAALEKYEPFIVQSRNFPLMLYCALTGELIDKSLAAVKQHMQGKKFQRAKGQFADDKLELKPEPTLESFGIKTGGAAGAGAAAAEAGQQQAKHGAAAAAAAAGDDDEPEFWVPEGAAEGSSDGEGEAGSGDSQGDDDALGSSGSSEGEDEGSDDDPMEEDTDAADGAEAAAAAASKKKASKGGSKAAGKQQQRKAGSKGAASNGHAAGATKKRNVQRPSASKKARTGLGVVN